MLITFLANLKKICILELQHCSAFVRNYPSQILLNTIQVYGYKYRIVLYCTPPTTLLNTWTWNNAQQNAKARIIYHNGWWGEHDGQVRVLLSPLRLLCVYLHLAVSRKITTTNKLIHRECGRYAVVLLNKANQSYNNYIPSCRRVVPKHSKW